MTFLAAIRDLSQVATGGLLAAVWQGMLLAAVVVVVLRLVPKTPAAVRFAIWFAVFVMVTGLPVFSLWHHAPGSTQVGGSGAWLILDARWSLAIAAIWAVASLARAGTLVVAAVRVRTLWKRAKVVEYFGRVEENDPTINARCGHVDYGAPGVLEGTGSSARRALICTSDEVDRPTVIGFFSPKILIPTWLLEKLTAAELEQIVLHETSHLGRADDWMNLLQKVALVVFPLNPALAWVERRLCFERELACDERVLRTTQAPKAYAACLASLAEHRIGRRGLALALGALGRESELGRRVGRILRRGEAMRPVHAKLVLGGAMLGLLCGAVGLERCPQVIGFAAVPEQNAAVVTPTRPGAASGLGYQAAMFHVNSIQRSFFNNDLVEKLNVSHDVSLRVSAGSGTGATETGLQRSKPHIGNGVHGTTEAVPFGKTDVSERNKTEIWSRENDVSERSFDNAAGQRPAERTVRVVQWMMVTSWQGADGSRLVLTTAQTSPVPVRVFSDLPAGSEDERSMRQHEQPSELVYPYAAVPVRGGWLVFQL